MVCLFIVAAGLPLPDVVLMLEGRIGKDPEFSGFDVVRSGEGEWDITMRVFRDTSIALGET